MRPAIEHVFVHASFAAIMQAIFNQELVSVFSSALFAIYFELGNWLDKVRDPNRGEGFSLNDFVFRIIGVLVFALFLGIVNYMVIVTGKQSRRKYRD